MEGQAPSVVGQSSAYIKIMEQPAPNEQRFRYPSETENTAGSLRGVNSTSEHMTYPTIQIARYTGTVMIRVSCVTNDSPYKAHPNNLVGKDCKDGVCTVQVNNLVNMVVIFEHLGIQCVKTKQIDSVLEFRERMGVDPFGEGFEHRKEVRRINTKAVRLCFEAYLQNEVGEITHSLKPAVSETINSRDPLVIHKVSHDAVSVSGGLKIILLCDYVDPRDISVVFYEEKDGRVVWKAEVEIGPNQVHEHYAIHFTTPIYKNLQVANEVQVFIQLRKLSDNRVRGKGMPFKLKPVHAHKRS